MKFNFSEIFTLDLRSLALTRIGIGTLVLVDLISRATYLTALHGDAGVLPTSFLHSFWAGEWAWSLHAIQGGPTWLLIVLFVIHGVAAAALTVGYKTRIASIVTWFLMVSLHNVNPLIVDGGDVLLRVYLFIGMFLPWGAVFSLDYWRGKYQPVSNSILSGWSVAYMLQIGLFYFFASALKNGPEWTRDGSAVYYALSIDQYATSLGKFLLNFPELLTVLTFSIVAFQHIVLFMLFSPAYTRYLRTFAVSALVFMHVSFTLMLHLWIFSWVAVAGLVGLLPSAVWDTSLSLVKKIAVRGAGLISVHDVAGKRRPRDFSKDVGGIVGSVTALCFIVFIFLWQIYTLSLEGVRPAWWDAPVRILRIEQRWGLFAPAPFKNDGWYVIDGQLKNGDRVDLLRGGTVAFEKPVDVYATYPNVRWRKYLYELRQNVNERYRQSYGEYLCLEWNNEHSQEHVLTDIHMWYVTERTPPPYRDQKKPQLFILSTIQCLDRVSGEQY